MKKVIAAALFLAFGLASWPTPAPDGSHGKARAGHNAPVMRADGSHG
jgi:hypothetical protein